MKEVNKKWPLAISVLCLSIVFQYNACGVGFEAINSSSSSSILEPEPTSFNKQCNQTTNAPGKTRIWKLSNTQYNNTIRDLLGDSTDYGKEFEIGTSDTGFANSSNVGFVSTTLLEQYMSAAENIAQFAVSNLSKVLPCSPADPSNNSCVEKFISEFGKKVYRQPVPLASKNRLYKLYLERKKVSAEEGLKTVIESMVLSPYFIYRHEMGKKVGSGSIVKLTSYEMASALSYLLWNTTPDDILMKEAAENKLNSLSGLQTTVARMLKDTKAKHVFWEFFSSYFKLKNLPDEIKDQEMFPLFNSQLTKDLMTEAETFVNEVIWNESGTFKEIITAQYSYLNPNLFKSKPF